MSLQLDSTPLSTAARCVAVVAGIPPSSLSVSAPSGSSPLSLSSSPSAAGVAVLSALAQLQPKAGLTGQSDAEQKQIVERLALVGAEQQPTGQAFLSKLESHLLVSSFLAPLSHRPSVADYAAWSVVREAVQQQAAAYPNLARWSRAVAVSIPRVGAGAEAFLAGTELLGQDVAAQVEAALPPSKLLELDIQATIAAEAAKTRGAAQQANVTVAAPPAGKAAAAKPAAKDGAAPAKDAKKEGGKDAKKDAKKEKAAKEPKKAAAASSDAVPQVYRVDFRVGRIVSCEPHPTEARLLVEQIDVGAEAGGVRTVVSGLADYFKPAELVDRLVVVMVNVKAGDMKGVESAGRVMVATSADGATKELATPPAGAQVGERITFATVPDTHKPDQSIASKRLHEVMKGLHTNKDKVVQYQDLDFQTSAGPVAVPTVAEGVVA